MYLQRTYYDNVSGGIILRVDTIMMQRKNDFIHGIDEGYTYERVVQTRSVHKGASPSRVVKLIQIDGDFDDCDSTSGDFTWASWDDPEYRVNMSDLPAVNDTV